MPADLLTRLPEWLGVVAVLMLASLSPRFKRPPLVFVYARRDGTLALSLFVLVTVLALVLTRVDLSGYLALFNDNLQGTAVRVLLALASAAPVIVALLARQQPWRSAGWNRAVQSPSVQLGLALAFLTIFLRGKFNNLFSLDPTALTALWLLMLAVLAEETIFRGYIQLRLTTWWGKIPAWLATAGLFLLWQLPRLAANPEALLFNLVSSAVQALLCGWMMRQTGSVIAPAMYRAVSDWLVFV